MLRRKPIVPGVRPLIDIGYKYNVFNGLSFIVTNNAGSIQADLPYLSKYPDQFTNFSICPFARPFVISKLYFSVN